jgi:hypothetical protein
MLLVPAKLLQTLPELRPQNLGLLAHSPLMGFNFSEFLLRYTRQVHFGGISHSPRLRVRD